MAQWHCKRCGEVHGELPMHYGAPVPAMLYTLAEAERNERALLTPDTCLIDEQYGFIVGNLEIPLIESHEHFSWDVWVSLSLPNFKRVLELWDRPGRESEPPCFGWLSTSLRGYPETLNLKTNVHTREVGRRPLVELEPTAHPLAVEQRQGITLARVEEIAELVLHGQ